MGEIIIIPGVTCVLVYNCAVHSLSQLPAFYANPDNIELRTLQERVDVMSTSAGVTAQGAGPDAATDLSAHCPIKQRIFSAGGRPAAATTVTPGPHTHTHAAYTHHDTDRHCFIGRTFGRGSTRVDHQRRPGVGRGYSMKSSAPHPAQRR